MATIDFSDTIAHWQPLTRPRASDLEDTRKQLHWAAQIVSALGTTLVEPRSDHSHTNLEWSQAHRGLLSQTHVGKPELRALLRFPDVTIELLRGEGDNERTLLSLPLAGRRFADVFDELERAVGKALGRDDFELRRPEHDLPSHRVDPSGAGEPFGGWQPHALVELTRWFANGDRALRELAAQDPRATPVRCWPHNFDIAILLVLERERTDDPDSDVTRSVGVGMTPGDGSYADAYWYVMPWPHAAEPELAKLDGGGIWHREGWVGAVLTSTALREPQAERFAAFMRSALVACEAMVL
ncbi:MAG TPA: hypothetical protein VM869_10415 [Enhygromyxa sp.]|nr:hypothetical protein [Enhygromyxa sp.]